MNRVWTLAIHLALGTTCRGAAPTPPPRADGATPAPPTPSRSSESGAAGLGMHARPANNGLPFAYDDTSPAGIARRFLREGTYSSREQTFRPGLTLEGALEGEIERDGSHGQLVMLGVPNGTGVVFDRVLVYLRHTAAGWRSELFPAYTLPGSFWRRPFILSGRTVFVVLTHNLVHSEPGSPGGVTYQYTLASRDAGGRLFAFDGHLWTAAYNERLTFAGLPDGSVQLTSVRPRGGARWRAFRVDWTARRVLVPEPGDDQGPWTAGEPPVRDPQVPVTLMDGVTCRAEIHAPFHLRDSETATSTGVEFPANTNVTILAETSLGRRDARLYRVRIANADGGSGPTGFAFVRGTEIADSTCPLL